MKTNQNPNNSYQENNINIYNDISLDEIIKEEDYKIKYFYYRKKCEDLIEQKKKLLLKNEELNNKLNIQQQQYETKIDNIEKKKKQYEEKNLTLNKIINRNEVEKKHLTEQIEILNELLKEKEEMINKQQFIINIYHKTNFELNKKFAPNEQVINNIINQNPILNLDGNKNNNLKESISEYNDSEPTLASEQLRGLNLRDVNDDTH